MRKDKTRISWVWNIRNDHNGVRKKASEHGLWGMKQIHQVAWKFWTQNLVGTYTLTLRQNLEHFLKSILSILYIISMGIQESNASNGVQIRVEIKKLWPFEDNCAKLKDHFKIQLMNSKWPNFEFTYCHFDVLLPLP